MLPIFEAYLKCLEVLHTDMQRIIEGLSLAALDWSPARVLAHPGLRALELEAWREALQVMGALRIRPVDLPGYRVDWAARAVGSLPDFALRPLAYAAGRGRAGRVPGTVADLRSGRHRTEIDALHGAVAEAAAATSVAAPTNRGIALLVGRIASETAAWDEYRGRPDTVIRAVRSLGAS